MCIEYSGIIQDGLIIYKEVVLTFLKLDSTLAKSISFTNMFAVKL